MTGRRLWATLLYAALAALYLLHNDLWLWNDRRLVLGLPIGLAYHLGFCVAASAVLALLVVLAWPPWSRGWRPASEPSDPETLGPSDPENLKT
jgi:hypothetical protein